jgi:hypothetical protein
VGLKELNNIRINKSTSDRDITSSLGAKFDIIICKIIMIIVQKVTMANCNPGFVDPFLRKRENLQMCPFQTHLPERLDELATSL